MRSTSTLPTMPRQPMMPTETAMTPLLDEDLDRRCAQIVVRAHRVAIGAGVRDEEDVTFLGWRQRTIRPELIATLADGPDHRIGLRRRLVDAGQIHDLVPRTIKSRANEGIHAGCHADVTHRSLA